jgi:hypothetical protein
MTSYIPPSVEQRSTNRCTNCFSGCVETTSDKCIKYTGDNITFLNINTGDTLISVVENITDYLTSVLSGEGVNPVIDPNEICQTVADLLPVEPTLVDILTALVQTVCILEQQILVEEARIDVIEDDYNVDCLSVAVNAGTHAVLQVVIAKVCELVTITNNLINFDATCVTDSTIGGYIQTYLNNITANTKMNSRMVPYVIYPYYPLAGDLSVFDANGVGTVGGQWEEIYLCNGFQGKTPDLRGRILVGTIPMASNDPLNYDVDPHHTGNPNYTIGITWGTNTASLAIDNLPEHSHTLSTDVGHRHTVPSNSPAVAPNLSTAAGDYAYPGGTELSTLNGEHTHTVGLEGHNVPHQNIPPVHATYYIMYVPA